jgi:hypothetical protein
MFAACCSRLEVSFTGPKAASREQRAASRELRAPNPEARIPNPGIEVPLVLVFHSLERP